MQIAVNTIITLENNEKYVVLNETYYQEDKYFLVMGIDDNKEIISSKVAIFKEILDIDGVYIDKESDPQIIIDLTKKFKEQM